MAEMFNFKTPPAPPQDANEAYVRANVNQAVKFYKNEKLPEGVKFKLTSAQSKTDSCKNGLLEISWSAGYRPKYPQKIYPTVCVPVETYHHPEEFLGRLIRTYESIRDHAIKQNQRIKRDNEL